LICLDLRNVFLRRIQGSENVGVENVGSEPRSCVGSEPRSCAGSEPRSCAGSAQEEPGSCVDPVLNLMTCYHILGLKELS